MLRIGSWGGLWGGEWGGLWGGEGIIGREMRRGGSAGWWVDVRGAGFGFGFGVGGEEGKRKGED